MNFPERTINKIKNLYANTLCTPLISDVYIHEFLLTSAVSQGYSPSVVLFNIAMIRLLAKLNCLASHTTGRPYQLMAEKFLTKKGIPTYGNIASAFADDVISVVKLDLRNNDWKLMIDKIL